MVDMNRKTSGYWVKLVLAVAGVILLVTLCTLAALGYVDQFSNALLEENSNYLGEITEHIAVNVGVVVNNMKKAMESVGLTIAGGRQEDESRIYMNSLCAKYDFEYVGVAKSDGMLHATMAEEEQDISGAAYFQKAMDGESVVTYVPVKIFQDKVISGILISVPLYDLAVDAEHPIGVLVTMLDMKKFADSVYISGFNGQGSTYIINGSGEILLQTKRLDYSNLFTVLANNEFAAGYSLDQMRADLNARTPGFAVYSMFGMEEFMHYRPLGIDDWSVVTVIQKDLITAKTTRLTHELLAIGIGVVILFPLLLIFTLSALGVSKANRQATRAKSAFLANMSHEIRTPMNAIVGIGEILLREDINDQQKNYVMSIVNAGNGLLTIINDVLDFSKIESGKFSMIEEEYELESLVYDIVAVIAVRIGEKPIRLLVDLDPALPKLMVGDMTRLKQVLINIIGNAVKFTNSGFIKMGIYGEWKNGKILLTIPVEDSGIGIKRADLEKLFTSFSQVDTHKNRSIEGTGLGLVISKQLCEMMGGDITVDSTYGEGSIFTVRVEQTAVNEMRMIEAPQPEGLRLLLLEPSELLRAHFTACIERLHLAYHFAEDFEAFLAAAQTGEYTHALADRQSLHRLAEESPEPPRLTPVALVGLQDQTNVQDYGRTIVSPLFTLQLAAVLCNRSTLATVLQRGGIDILSIQPMPFVRVLLVDDNEVNLQVANGLMVPYHMQVDCASSGRSAVNMAGINDYDLVFMDHMMPEMDGVEALKLIRTLPGARKSVPVIALTANVTRGAQELFLQSGFDDFLSKPIDTVRLNVVLKKWLKDANESREKENPEKARAFYEQLSLAGHGGPGKDNREHWKNGAYVDFVAGGLRLGSSEVYRSILATYRRSAKEKLQSLPLLLDTNLEKFTIEVHGLKGASAGVCALAMADGAAKLEQMGKDKRVQEIREYLPVLLAILQKTLAEIEQFIGPLGQEDEQQIELKTGPFSAGELLTLKEAFWAFDSERIQLLLFELGVCRYETGEQKLLDGLNQRFRAYDFDTPVKLLEEYERQCQKEGTENDRD